MQSRPRGKNGSFRVEAATSSSLTTPRPRNRKWSQIRMLTERSLRWTTCSRALTELIVRGLGAAQSEVRTSSLSPWRGFCRIASAEKMSVRQWASFPRSTNRPKSPDRPLSTRDASPTSSSKRVKVHGKVPMRWEPSARRRNWMSKTSIRRQMKAKSWALWSKPESTRTNRRINRIN